MNEFKQIKQIKVVEFLPTFKFSGKTIKKKSKITGKIGKKKKKSIKAHKQKRIKCSNK